MTISTIESLLLQRLEEIRPLCPDMRFGQLMAWLGELSEDETGRGLWDVEDDQLLTAMDRLKVQLLRRLDNAE